MAKYAVGYLIAFLFLAVILTGFLGFGFGGQDMVIRERPGVVVPPFSDPPSAPAPDTGR